jgi:hypothetical protein
MFASIKSYFVVSRLWVPAESVIYVVTLYGTAPALDAFYAPDIITRMLNLLILRTHYDV